MATQTVPVVDWVDAQQLLADPYPTYARLRAEAPVAHVPSLGRYLITSFQDCFDAEMDQETFSSHEREERSTLIRSMGRPLIRKDDPQHKEERNAMSPALKPITIKKHWSAVFQSNADKYVAQLRDAGSGADLFHLFAVPYAADNLCAVIGFGDVLPGQMMNWSHTLIRGTGNVLDDPRVWAETDTVCEEIDDAIDRACARIMNAPDPSMISAMLNAGLVGDDLRANVRLTIAGGMNEPSHAISSAVWSLSAFPRQRELVLAGDRTWRDVFEETARFQSPVGMYPRRTTRDVVIGGASIPENSTVAIVVASANRDAAKFTDPDVFDLSRDSMSHLAFGNGTHICAGNWIARAMVGEIALPTLYREFPNLTVPEPVSVEFHGWVFRGTTSLPVQWDAR